MGFDKSFKVLDATSGSEFLHIEHQSKHNFTTFAWDNRVHELVIADDRGTVGIWNVYNDQPLFWGKIFTEEKRILGLALREGHAEVLVATDTTLHLFSVRREQSSYDIQGHSGPVIALFAQEAHLVPRLHSNDKPRFITCAVDNTLKV